MKFFKHTIIVALAIVFASCEGILDGVNENPNNIVSEEVSAELFLTGAQLANISAQVGHSSRIAGMYSGQLVGLASFYSNIYGFNISTTESNTTWSRIYIGAVTNLRTIREVAPDDALLVGIAKTIEAHAVGTAASLYGDVPYSEINDLTVSNPEFDSQVSVFNAVIDLLDEAILDLERTDGRRLDADIYFQGDADKWMEAAYTLKARYHLQLKDYPTALAAAQNGISNHEGTMKFVPRGSVDATVGDKNLFFQILEGARTGDIGTANSYLMQLLDESSEVSRANSKTNEAARFGYYTIDESGGKANQGFAEQFEPQILVSYAENQLILAETATRVNGFNDGLAHLNDYRAWLSTGDMVNDNFKDLPHVYEAYDNQDFEPGGMVNEDNIDQTRALLREVIEERYVSGFGTYIPFNDARRLRANDSDIAVPFIMVDGPNPPFAERFPYSVDELNSNSNAPQEDPGIFTKTEVNR